MLIFFDIDGTLLDETTHTVPQSAINAIKEAKQNGHQCFINTGRPISTIDQIIKEIDFDGYVCGCGTYICHNSKTIYHHKLNQDIQKKIIDMTFKYQVETVLEGEYGAYFPSFMSHPFVKDIYHRYQNQGFPVYIYNQNDSIHFDKFAVWYKDVASKEKFRSLLKDDFTIIERDHDFDEIIPKSCSKATGIEFICQYFNIPHSQTLSIGDSTNDLAMLEHTQYSVAMKKSHPALYDKVTYITSDLNDNGIYNALKHYHLIK